MTPSLLSSAEIEQFLTRGFVRVRECFGRDAAAQLTDQIWPRLGYSLGDRSTWQQSRVHMPSTRRFEIRTFAPKAWDVICELCGGEDRIAQPANWSDALIVNFNDGANQPWVPPTPQAKGWHKDGDFFMHFLDSPEQALLTIVVWSDIEPRGGGTFLACDSVAQVARYLAQHPEGVHPYKFPTQTFVDPCTDFIEATGRVGDVYIMHPYMVHASSFNHSQTVRVITNPPVALKEPMQFKRSDPAGYSPVERAVLRGLGVSERDGFDFQPTAPRERVVPERVRIQQQMLEEEKKRMGNITGVENY